MTYDGTMVMPRNCVAMTEDEMIYAEGGNPIVIPALAIGGAVLAGLTFSYKGGEAIAKYLIIMVKQRPRQFIMRDNLYFLFLQEQVYWHLILDLKTNTMI